MDITLSIQRQESYSRGELLLRSFFGVFYILIPHAIALLFVSLWGAILQFLTKMIDACVTQGRRSTLQRLTVYSLGAAGAANLECRVWCVQVGRGVVKAEQDHTEDHEILPEGIAIEHGKLVS